MRRLALAALLAAAACGVEEPPADAGGDPPSQAQEAPSTEEVVPPAATGPDAWRILPEASRVMFTGRQGDDAFTGRFSRFDAQVTLDPDDPTGASIVASVDLSSVDAGSGDRNDSLPESGWFDTARHPRATFRSESVEAVEGGYEAEGTLTLKGIERDVVMPFTLSVEGGRAVADATLTLDRTDFRVGEGDFAGPEWVGTAVEVQIHVEAVSAGG